MVSGEATDELSSGPARKRPRLLEEAVKAGDGVAIGFAPSFASDNQNLVLLQVPESLLGEIGRDADLDLVRLIGGEEEDAVLVTGGQTFKLTKAETSNTLLLLPPEGSLSGGGLASGGGGGTGVSNGRGGGGVGAGEEGGFEAVAAVGFQFELSKATPSLEQIRVILGACLYRGKGEESSADRERLEMCTLEELQNRVQFSHRELLEGLEEMGALCVEGRWRMVEPELVERTADELLSVVVEQDMPLDRVDPKACVEALPHCEAQVVEHCLRTYSCSAAAKNTTHEGTDAAVCSESGYRRLDLDKVARLRAHQILRAYQEEDNDNKPIALDDFMERWATSMPGVDTPAQDLLKGIALIERKGSGSGETNDASLAYVPASGLPFAPADRLAALFRIKPKWPMGELEPYISEADKKAGFLLKHARFSTDPATGQKLFSAR